ncbi:ATP-binding protein [Phaeovulum vinaykumarii]|uniref:histidine kinase n=1 Tax=Phaeovulum vinaykumarii TaxID=407234 RepID=A0A1N7LIP4_9RHOB|nr:ATP-binding protein [Phaeovulum vinaykumarii]SIS73621.1 two-component system, OmpR family, phosphate regulon sensor histidine kinase PhoR [Phaeovulum vinaykumarii]SOC04726.1 two-component system phosphate regulon sensor histidine kinase PhoR [Phaeovulum vinaykumarii]
MHDASGESQIRALAEAVPLAVLVVSRAERIVVANAAACAMLGSNPEGRPFVTFLRQPAIGDAVEGALREGRAAKVRVTIAGGRDARGEIVTQLSVAPLSGSHAALVFEDISAQENAEVIRREFVANVSHELRTPLTALLGFIETLKGAAKDDPVARERFLDIMAREAGRMNRLVADLLSLSRVEAEERRRPTGRVDVVGLVQSSLMTLRAQAREAGVDLHAEGIEAPLPVPGDPDQLTQVIHNLIENAVKYGGSGGEVRVRLSRVEHEPVLRGPALQIEVIDRGEGIDPIHLPRLTERFYRVDNHRSREKGGTGLGLAIVKHIIARHRGRMKIDSEKGRGSRFIVLLPMG